MGWIRWTGKTLEFVGKLAQMDTFEKWAESQGEKIITDLALKSGGVFFGMGKETRAKSIVWEDLKTIAEKSPSLNASVKDFVLHFPDIVSSIANETTRLPHKTYSFLVVPRFLVNEIARSQLKDRLDGSQELANLKGGAELREYFFDELIRQLDEQFTEQGSKANPDKPIQIGDKWIVGFDEHYVWMNIPGHYFVYSSYLQTRSSADGKAKKQGHRDAEIQLQECLKWLGELTAAEREALALKL